MKRLVLKFGGTSVGTVEKIKKVADIIKKRLNEGNEIIVVVSAMSGVTDELKAKSDLISKNFDNKELDVLLSSGEQISSSLLSGALLDLGVKKAVTLGAFFGQVAHTLPVPIFGVSDDPTFHARYNVLPTNYSGPTGITSVVGHDLRGNGIETAGLWAAVPHYLSAGGYPKGISALLNKTAEILDIEVDDTGIQTEGQQFDMKINKAMENSRDLADYVSKLEEAEVNIEDNFSEDNLVEQIEDFLNNEGRET